MKKLLLGIACALTAGLAIGEVPAWQIEGLLPQFADKGLESVTDAELDALLASEPEPDAKVVYDRGMPKFSLNGKLIDVDINQSGAGIPWRASAAVKAASLGLTINQVAFRAAQFEKEPGVYDFSVFDGQIRRMLKAVPEARLLMLLRMDFPKWTAAHPEGRIEYATGPVEGERGDERLQRLARPSAASPAFRAEVDRFLRQLGAYVCSRPWGKRVVAVRPSWGIYTEWHTYGMYEGPDVGPAMTAVFRRWKGGKYANENPPTMEERVSDDLFYFDAEKHRKAIDFYECMAETVSDFLLEVAHTTKAAFPGRLVGMYYGYVLTDHPPEGANVMLDKVLASPDVDFLSDPADYTAESRRAGGAYYHRTIPSTYRRYGKIAILEDDMRHHHIFDFVSHKYICTRSPRESEMTTRRNWLNRYFDACGIQILDPESNYDKRPFTMDTFPVWRAIADTKNVLANLDERPVDSGNDVAVVVDWRECLRRSPKEDDRFVEVCVRPVSGLYASGVPFDLMTLDDFLAQPEGRYSRAVFLNVFSPEGELKPALEKRVAAPGFRSAWMLRCPFPGLASDARRVCEEPPEGGEAWRDVLVGLGARPVAPAGHLVRRHGDYLMFHTGKTGTWELDVPGCCGARELYSGRSYRGGRFTVETDGPDTLFFRLERRNGADMTPPRWAPVTQESKPWVYNWWMASAVDRAGLEAQCKAMDEAGLGGFHVIPIYGAKGYESKYLRYLSPEWMKAFSDAVRIGERHGLGVDMTMGNGWCFGGPQLEPGQGCWKLEKTPDGRAPYVTWKLTGQQVKRAGPGGQGPMMDPYSVDAIDAFMKPYSVFDAPDAARPRRVYHDSWEYYNAGWSPALFDAFKAKRGYDLRDHQKELAGIGDPEEVARIKCDYRETLSDLVIDDVFPRWVDWAHRHGIQTRNEAHGTCANWLDFYAIADMPETEMFAEECRDILVSKFASSAAHVCRKKFVSSESCTWLGEHFTETLSDFKIFIDRLLLSGVNHMYYHGCCYSPVDAVWPGWCFYASCEMNPRNPIWRDAKYLNAYIARVQAMFQACESDNDTLLYWPLRDYWWDAEGFEKQMSVHNAGKWFYGQPIGEVAKRLAAEGQTFDYVSDRQLQRLDLSRYAKIVVPPCEHMPEATKAAIAKFQERPVRREPFASAGLAFSRYRRGDETVYFLVNTNGTPVTADANPSAEGAKWWMNPMTGEVKPLYGKISLEAYESGFLVVVKDGALPAAPAEAKPAAAEAAVEIAGPWTLEPVCGGPQLPAVRTMEKLTSWSRGADGGEDAFSGTMRYRTRFEWKGGTEGMVTLDLGQVSQSARVRINGRNAGFAIMAPYSVTFAAELLKPGVNDLEVEVTSTGANRIRWNDRNGVDWKYFTDAGMVAYGYTGDLDASGWPLRDYGLFGPVVLHR